MNFREIGLHQFKNNDEACYYFERPAGNILIYADKADYLDENILKLRGGLFKQFVESPEIVTEFQKKVFDKFGASAVYVNSDCPENSSNIRYECFGKDYIDSNISLSMSECGGHILELSQRGKKVAIFGKDFFLERSGDVLFEDNYVETDVLAPYETGDFDLLLFSKFEDDNYLEV